MIARYVALDRRISGSAYSRTMRTMSEPDLHALAVIGQAMRIARERASLSQRRLAARSGVSQSAISRMERGSVRGIALRYFARVVATLGDTMPLVGCPHGHDCDYARQWRFARLQIAPELVTPRGFASDEGLTIYELTRQLEGELAEANA
jgi:transcriptional regulator with XRE-family HTH domain